MAFQRNFEDLGVQGGWNDPPDAAWKIKSPAGEVDPFEHGKDLKSTDTWISMNPYTCRWNIAQNAPCDI